MTCQHSAAVLTILTAVLVCLSLAHQGDNRFVPKLRVASQPGHPGKRVGILRHHGRELQLACVRGFHFVAESYCVQVIRLLAQRRR